MFRNFRNISITVKSGNLYLLGNALSTILDDEAITINVKVRYGNFLNFINCYGDSHWFEQIVKASHCKWTILIKKSAKLEYLISLLSMKQMRIPCNWKGCVCQTAVFSIWQTDHDSKIVDFWSLRNYVPRSQFSLATHCARYEEVYRWIYEPSVM